MAGRAGPGPVGGRGLGGLGRGGGAGPGPDQVVEGGEEVCPGRAGCGTDGVHLEGLVKDGSGVSTRNNTKC